MNSFKALAILAGGYAMTASPLAAQDAAAPAPQMTEAAAVQQAVDLGSKIYSYDQAAWHGTDAMLEDLPGARKNGIAGWIVNEVAGGWETVFFRLAGEGYEAVWAGVYDGKKVIRAATYAPGERALTPAETALVTATQLARSQRVQGCSAKPFNTVVFPTGRPDGGFYAYLLTPQEKVGEIPFGGHHRFEIVAGQIKASRKFTNSCLTMASLAADGKRPEALSISHLLDPVPTEIHVFSVYVAGLPVYVLTASNKTAWAVEVSGGKPRIRRVE
ncbi:MAG: hypothetical protein NBV68_16420 [Erythrobacter sp.]|uniref:hypothetical protein n=1 Tax=Erythrobacter sp. TaxID=1042 RepID=UPI0025ED871C|nr:hypothetical protein [Erythrobacter sp.]MCM0000962.1 hypothetical protein [Erythrobacter sp.]